MKVFAVMAWVGILGGTGCGAKPEAEQQEAPRAASALKTDLSSGWQSTALPSNAAPLPVKQGAAPLVYRVEGGATIRVREENAKLDLARGFVPAGSLVRVDGRRGVIYGEDTVYPGPLAEDGRYVIFV